MLTEWLALALQWVDAPAFAWGVWKASHGELIGALLSLGMVLFNMRVHPMGWPLAILASALYAWVFWDARLWGLASLQWLFMAMSAWGWWQWVYRGPDGQKAQTSPRWMSPVARWRSVLAVLVLWPLLALFLQYVAGSDLPWWDALPTAGSIVGTWMLARKYVENWIVWALVNGVSVLLFTWKGLWLTSIIYLIFLALSWEGYRSWLLKLNKN